MTSQQLLSALLLLLSARVAPQLVVRLFARMYPPGDPRAKEMIGEVYRIRHWQRLGWAFQQAELAWFEGLSARRLARAEKRELEAGVLGSQRQAALEEDRRQDEADFDAFLRGVGPALPARHAAPRRKRTALAPATLLASLGAGLGGLAAIEPSGGARSGAAQTLLPTWMPSLHAAAAVATAIALLALAVAAHAVRAGVLRLPATAGPAHRRRRRLTLIQARTARTGIAVVVDQGGRLTEGLALAWGGRRVLVASPTGRHWTPAARVRRQAA